MSEFKIALGEKKMTQGWAVMPLKTGCAHYWEDITGTPTLEKGLRIKRWESRCGLTTQTSDKAPPLDEGNFNRCKTCERASK